MSKPLILVTGKNGQLGWELSQLAVAHDAFDFVFLGRTELDLSDNLSIQACIEKYQPAYCINCAAYTAVDKAETEQAMAYQVNAAATGAMQMPAEKIMPRLLRYLQIMYLTAMVHNHMQ